MSVREIEGGVCAPKGFSAGSVYAGVRQAERDDFVLILSDREASVAAVLTRNIAKGWCVHHNSERIKSGKTWGVICNAGNANCLNGERGAKDDLALERAATSIARDIHGGAVTGVLTASTGVIGHPLPIERMLEALPHFAQVLGSEASHSERAARAIMTTDLVPKMCAVEVTSGNGTYRIGGMAKGSGMIAPNMATMLGFITCDAEADHTVIQPILRSVAARTFNCVSVDGDTSTNDTVLLLANGGSGTGIAGEEALFEDALELVCRSLAMQIARDGEGATKLITILLKNPPRGGEKIARTIAESPLVKTACFGNDPNWGRIVAAAGRSGVSFDPNALSVAIAGHEVYRDGQPAPFDEAEVSAAMKTKELVIELAFEGGEGPQYRFWTCDMTYDYVKINAEYTT